MSTCRDLVSNARFGLGLSQLRNTWVFTSTTLRGLGGSDKGQAIAGNRNQYVNVLFPGWMRHVVNAGRNSAKTIGFAHDDARGHFGVFALGPGMGTVFAVAGDITADPSSFCSWIALFISFSEPA